MQTALEMILALILAYTGIVFVALLFLLLFKRINRH